MKNLTDFRKTEETFRWIGHIIFSREDLMNERKGKEFYLSV